MEEAECPWDISELDNLKAFKKLRSEMEKGDVTRTTVYIASINAKGKNEIRELKCMQGKLLKIQDTMRVVDTSRMRSRAKISLSDRSFVPMIHCPGNGVRMAFFPLSSGLACVIDSTNSSCLEQCVIEHGRASKIPFCAFCDSQTDGRRKCGVCRTLYCDADCQRAHWPVHRKCCSQAHECRA